MKRDSIKISSNILNLKASLCFVSLNHLKVSLGQIFFGGTKSLFGTNCFGVFPWALSSASGYMKLKEVWAPLWEPSWFYEETLILNLEDPAIIVLIRLNIHHKPRTSKVEKKYWFSPFLPMVNAILCSLCLPKESAPEWRPCELSHFAI